MIYPFKNMVGNQPADAVNKTVLVPNLFGNATTDPDAFWVSFDWARAPGERRGLLRGQPYTGAFEFVDTVMLLKVDHGVAPKRDAYGMGGDCADCHLTDAIDWAALGWTGDPIRTGTPPRPTLPN